MPPFFLSLSLSPSYSSCETIADLCECLSPGVVFLLGQFVTVGSVFPIYLFILYTTTSVSRLSAADRLIPAAEAQAMLPAVVLGYLSSAVPSLVHPNLIARQWWSWLWQLYPIWTALFFNPLTKVFRSSHPPARTGSAAAATASSSSMSAVRRTIFVLVATGAVTYWYTLATSGLSLAELYLPKYVFQTPPDAPTALRTVVRYDYLTTFAATLLWLALEFQDIKTTSSGTPGLVTLGAAGVAAALMLGPGSVLTLGWWWREEILMGKGRVDAKRQ